MVLKAWKNLKPGEVLASEALFVGGILRRTSSQHRAPGGEADCLVQASLLLIWPQFCWIRVSFNHMISRRLYSQMYRGILSPLNTSQWGINLEYSYPRNT